MPRRTNPTLLSLLLLAGSAQAAAAVGARPAALFPPAASALASTDREQDGLVGPVRRVKTETAKISVKNGKPLEGQRVLLEATTYDMKGNRVDNAYYLAAGGSLTGKEVYKYDERGNIIEMTLQNADGSLLSKETYAYEFDAVGNWVKMTTSVAVIEGGKINFEPSEVTYRTIAYYLDEGMLAKMSAPAAPAAAPAAAVNLPASAPANRPAAAASPQPATPKPSAASAAAAPPVKTTATPAPVVLASLDKAAAPAPPPSLATSATAPSSAPVVKPEGEAPSRPVARGPVKPVSGGILNGKALSLPAPYYPDMAKRSRAMGTVEVEVVIDVSGKVIAARAVGGPLMLRMAAEEAASKARFSPTLLSGQPVKVSGTITYNFSLN